MIGERAIEFLVRILGTERARQALQRTEKGIRGTGDEAKKTTGKAAGLTAAFGGLGARLAGLVGAGAVFAKVLQWFRDMNQEIAEGAGRLGEYVTAFSALVSVAGDPKVAEVVKGMAPYALRPVPQVAQAYQMFLGGIQGMGWTPQQAQEYFRRDVLALGRTELDVPLRQIVGMMTTIYQAAPQIARRGPGAAANLVIGVEDPARINLAQMGAQFPRILGALQPQLGLGPGEAGALFAQVTKSLGKVEQAATGLAFLMTQAAAPTEQLAETFKRLGIKPGAAPFVTVMERMMAAQAAGEITPTELRAFTGMEGMAVFGAFQRGWPQARGLMRDIPAGVAGPPLAEARWQRIMQVPGAPAEVMRRAEEIRGDIELAKPRFAQIRAAREWLDTWMKEAGYGAFARRWYLRFYDASTVVGVDPEEAINTSLPPGLRPGRAPSTRGFGALPGAYPTRPVIPREEMPGAEWKRQLKPEVPPLPGLGEFRQQLGRMGGSTIVNIDNSTHGDTYTEPRDLTTVPAEDKIELGYEH